MMTLALGIQNDTRTSGELRSRLTPLAWDGKESGGCCRRNSRTSGRTPPIARPERAADRRRRPGLQGPLPKPRGKPMPEPRARANAARSRERAGVEHVFATRSTAWGRRFAPSASSAPAPRSAWPTSPTVSAAVSSCNQSRSRTSANRHHNLDSARGQVRRVGEVLLGQPPPLANPPKPFGDVLRVSLHDLHGRAP